VMDSPFGERAHIGPEHSLAVLRTLWCTQYSLYHLSLRNSHRDYNLNVYCQFHLHNGTLQLNDHFMTSLQQNLIRLISCSHTWLL
jgi:hypothetical protein